MNDQQHGLLYEIGSWIFIGALITGLAYVLASPLGLVLAICGVPHPFQRAADMLLRLVAIITLIFTLMMVFWVSRQIFGF